MCFLTFSLTPRTVMPSMIAASLMLSTFFAAINEYCSMRSSCSLISGSIISAEFEGLLTGTSCLGWLCSTSALIAGSVLLLYQGENALRFE